MANPRAAGQVTAFLSTMRVQSSLLDYLMMPTML